MIMDFLLDQRQQLAHPNRHISRYCRDQQVKAMENSLLMIKILQSLALFGFLNMLFIGMVLDYFFNKNNYPLPMPYNNPFFDQTNLVAYILTLIHQAVTIFTAVTTSCVYCCTGLFTLFYGVLLQDMTIRLASKMEEIRNEVSLDYFCKLIVGCQITFRR